MDFDSRELASYKGAPSVEPEFNPSLGLRGLSWELAERRVLALELRALLEALNRGYSNLGVLFPMVRTIEEYEQAREVMTSVGLRPQKDIRTGVVFETPSAALQIREFLSVGIDFAFIGINDLTQYTLAVDRTNVCVKEQSRYSEHENLIERKDEQAESLIQETGGVTSPVRKQRPERSRVR